MLFLLHCCLYNDPANEHWTNQGAAKSTSSDHILPGLMTDIDQAIISGVERRVTEMIRWYPVLGSSQLQKCCPNFKIGVIWIN